MNAQRVLIVGPLPGHLGSRGTGGIATHVLELAQGLAAEGRGVAVYADNMPPADDPLEQDWGAVFSAAPLSKSLGGAMTALGNAGLVSGTRKLMTVAESQGKRFGPTFSHVLGLSRAVEKHQPDVIHYHQPDMRVLYARMANVISVPSVATQHSLSGFADDVPESLGELILENLRMMDAVIAVSSDVASGLTKRAPDIEATVIPNGVDLSRFSNALTPTPPAKTGGATVAYVGRIAPGKGVEDLIAAMVLVRETIADARLDLAGPVVDLDIDEITAETGLSADAFTLLGDLAPEGVAGALAAADVFVLPSHLREGQPRSIIESLAAGTPVVASCIGGIPGLLRGGAGELVDPGDIPALARAVTRVLTEPEFTARLIEVGLTRAEEYDLTKTTAEVAEIYEAAAG